MLSVLFCAACWMLALALWTFAKVQNERLEMLRDDMAFTCWRLWSASHQPDAVPGVRKWHGRYVPVECDTP